MIYSLTSFFNEVELFDIRYEVLKPLECKHIVTESLYTHSGDPKTENFVKDGEDIVHILCVDEPDKDTWVNEKRQRDGAKKYFDSLAKINDDDIIIITDLDEIPDPLAIKEFDLDMNVAALRMNHYSYYLNVLQGRQTWNVGKICSGKYFRGKTPSEIRNAGAYYDIPFAGWHFSWLGGADKIIEKFWAYAHVESINEFTTDKENIERKLRENQSLWTERPDDLWQLVPIDESFPYYIVENEELLTQKGLIKPYK